MYEYTSNGKEDWDLIVGSTLSSQFLEGSDTQFDYGLQPTEPLAAPASLLCLPTPISHNVAPPAAPAPLSSFPSPITQTLDLYGALAPAADERTEPDFRPERARIALRTRAPYKPREKRSDLPKERLEFLDKHSKTQRGCRERLKDSLGELVSVLSNPDWTDRPSHFDSNPVSKPQAVELARHRILGLEAKTVQLEEENARLEAEIQQLRLVLNGQLPHQPIMGQIVGSEAVNVTGTGIGFGSVGTAGTNMMGNAIYGLGGTHAGDDLDA